MSGETAVIASESERSVLESQHQELLVYWQRGPTASAPASSDTSLVNSDNQVRFTDGSATESFDRQLTQVPKMLVPTCLDFFRCVQVSFGCEAVMHFTTGVKHRVDDSTRLLCHRFVALLVLPHQNIQPMFNQSKSDSGWLM